MQSLEHETGGVAVYEAAVECAVNDDLKSEWEKCLDQTRSHVEILQSVCAAFELDPTQDSGKSVVRTVGEALVAAMKIAKESGNPEAAEIVACEAVSLAETKDHLDWELLGKCAEKLKGERGKTLKAACEEVEDQEDEHLYHTKGWCRELWLQSLGLPAVLPLLPRKPITSRRQSVPLVLSKRAKGPADTVNGTLRERCLRESPPSSARLALTHGGRAIRSNACASPSVASTGLRGQHRCPGCRARRAPLRPCSERRPGSSPALTASAKSREAEGGGRHASRHRLPRIHRGRSCAARRQADRLPGRFLREVHDHRRCQRLRPVLAGDG